MHARSALALTTLFIWPLVSCDGGGDDSTQKIAPNIELFEAVPSTVEEGQSTTLRYRVTEAATVRIDIMDGASVLPLTPTTEGEVTTPNLAATTTFVLTAAGLTGRTASASLTVLVQKEGAPMIASFTATPDTLEAGGTTTLAWEVVGASSARIEVPGSTLFTAPIDAVASGTFEHQPAQTTTYTLVTANEAGVEATTTVTVTVTNPMPVVRSFRATPATIDAGMSSVLSWEVGNATEVSITDDAGTSVYSGADLTGMVTVTPAATTRYTLSAGDGSSTPATQNVTVTVNPPMGAMIVRFAANPASILRGQGTTLEWEVQNAPGGIAITAAGSPVLTSTAATGTTMVMPALTTSYELVAFNPAGDAMQSATVTVTAPAGPMILSLAASPNPVAAGGTATISWTTLASTQVRVLRGATELLSTTVDVAQGSLQVSPAADTTYTLEASDGAQTVTQSILVHAHPAPVINTFTVTPVAITGPTNVTVTWDVSDYAQLTLTQDGAPVPGFSVPTSTAAALDHQGTLMVQVAQATLFELTAISAGGTETAQVQVGMPMIGQETEPNDEVATANPFDQGGVISGAIGTPGDIDIFRIMVPQDGNVRVETSDGMGGCATDTFVILLDANGDAITGDDDGGTAPCSLVDPTLDPAAANLPAGTYYVEVVHFDAQGTGAYSVNIRIGGAMCGNQIVDGTDQCDFGDFTDGDGCSATCQLEINPTVVSGTGGTVTVNLAPNGFGLIQIDVLAGQAVTATAADAGGTCDIADTALNFGDSNLLLLGSKADGGPTGAAGSCAAIHYPADAFAANLAAGTHYLVVFDESNAGGQVEVTVGILDPVCGNGFFETRTEECDDGNTAAGDLCDASCDLETSGVATLPSPTPVTLPGSLSAPNFANIIRVDVSSELYLNVDVFSPDQASGCPSADLVVELYDQTFNFLGGDDDLGVGSCPSFDELAPFSRLVPGTYYLVVYDFNFDTDVPAYEVVLGSVAVPANAPALEVEANDDQATATPTGISGAGTASLHGQMNADGDDDVYSFVVPAGQTLLVSARTYDVLGMPSACTPSSGITDTRLFLEAAGVPATTQGSGEIAYNDDLASNLWCSAIAPTSVTAGAQDTTFYVRVQGFNDTGLRYYFLDVTVQ